MNLDSASNTFEEIRQEFLNSASETISEQDVRFRLINRVLVEVLGWEFKEIQTEKPNPSGFSDYLLQSYGRTRAIVEAKRTSEKLTSSKAQSLSYLNVGGSGLDDARSAITQASQYCFQEGVDLAVLSNGTTWIIFRASRTDGKRPNDGKAAVFHSLDTVSQNFQIFYELLAREHLVNRVYQAILNEQEGFKLLPKEELHFAMGETSGGSGPRADHANDLDEIFETFFSTISGENDKELLVKCFVESKESQHAEKVLARITSDVLDRIEPMQNSAGGQLADEIERATRTSRGEKILLIGNKGSGKSTFVDRFFQMSLDPKMREKCLVLKLDLAKFEANEKSISEWLDRKLQQQLDQELYSGNPATYEELQGVFHSTYQKWSVGPHKHLHDTDLIKFKIKFGEHLADLTEKRPHDYCIAQLKNIVRSRKLLPCIVFDNADQFSGDVQQAVFQYANAVFEDVKVCFLIVPITDQTVWQLSKSGPLQSYHAKAFFLPVPSTKEVLEKRIRFLASEAELDQGKKKSGHYTLPNGFQVSLANLQAFAASLEEIFLNNDFVSRRIGFLSNFDIRRSLQLSKRMMTSPFIGLDDLVRAYLSSARLSISQENLSLALINGNQRLFRQEQSEFIVNLFSVSSSQISSPLLMLRILTLLIDKQRSVHDPLDSFLTCGEIEQYFDVLGVPGQITRACLQVLLTSRLIEPYNPTEGKVIEGQSVSITTSGELHIQLALHDRVYFSQMALVTGLRNPDVADSIREIYQSPTAEIQKLEKIRDLFIDYCRNQDATFIKIPQSNDNYKNQRSLIDELQAVPRLLNIAGRVKWFNPREGYGFIHIESNSVDAFLSLTVLEEFGIGSLHTDQAVKCSISQSARGWQVTDITEVSDISLGERDAKSEQNDIVMATVVFYNSTKGFGFLRPNDGGRDILLPRRTLIRNGLTDISDNTSVLVEVAMEMKGPVAMSIALED